MSKLTEEQVWEQFEDNLKISREKFEGDLNDWEAHSKAILKQYQVTIEAIMQDDPATEDAKLDT